LFLFLNFLNFSISVLRFQLEPKAVECFYQPMNAGEKARVEMFVTRGGLLDIDLKILAPGNVQIYAGLHFESAQYEFIAAFAGDYSICFSNEMARWTAKVIQFRVVKDNVQPKDGKPLTTDVLTPMQTSLLAISNSLDVIQVDQTHLRIREQVHRDTAESTNTRVYFYSLIESILLLIISIGQVFYLRKFFEIRRTV